MGFEGVADVLQEHQTEHDMLVFGGVHVVAELVGGEPELVLEADVGGGLLCRSIGGLTRAGHYGDSPRGIRALLSAYCNGQGR